MLLLLLLILSSCPLSKHTYLKTALSQNILTSKPSLLPSCFLWFFLIASLCSIKSNPMASTSTAAFHEIAPSASTSGRTSTLIQKPSFDVFINHRGPDVKKTLASKIYNVLVGMNVKAFLDSEELEYGDFWPTTIETAMRSATLHIAIFSKGYAESPWCLAELSSMLKSGAKIVPVFYFVEPTDLRLVAKGVGVYVGAFETHRKKGRYSPEKLQEWEAALYKVSFFTGEIIKNSDDEMKLLKNIVNTVSKEISNLSLIVAKHPVGLNEIVEDFENTFQLDQGHQGVQIVGIWGMGGLGKTTLAKDLYNKRSSSMERSSFIFDIREAKGVLQNKQIQLDKDLGGDGKFDNIEQGKAILARRLRSCRVLIVMDDVDHVDQLDALVPAKDSLGRGSLIIVTTREHQVLTSWGISFVYKMRALEPHDAKQLFCWHAFLQPSPQDGFEELVEKFLRACQGLPLSLKVFGAQLYGNSNKKSWESLLHRISRILHDDIKEKLKISYDALGNEEKEAFLDTACFFIGEKNSLAIEVWDGSEWSGLYSWESLLNKCLVELDHDNCIRMHDHLRDLGREIANQHSPWRLWSSKQITNPNNEIEKGNFVRGIQNVPIGIKKRKRRRSELTANISGSILLPAPSLVGLKLLVIRGDYFKQEIYEVSTELLWLRLSYIEQRNLPARLSLKTLRVLELHWSEYLEELWKAESDAPMQLRELVVRGCSKFRRFPNSIGCLNELKKIVIDTNSNLRSLPEEFCRLQLLEHLELKSCYMLSSLPNSFGDLTNLRYLNLSFCRSLMSLPVSFKNLMLLQYLKLTSCKKLMLRSDDFENITELEVLRLNLCSQLEELPHHITNQVSLRELYLESVGRLRELPMNIGQLSRLRKMEIGSRLFSCLPTSLGDLSSLTNLSIHDCSNLKSLPTTLGHLSSLTNLSIHDCSNLESLPTTLGHLSSLTNLSIYGCSNLESLPNSLENLASLTELSIKSCPKLKCLPCSVGRLHSLENLCISECPISQVDVGTVSLSFALTNLKRIILEKSGVCRISLSEDHCPCLKSLTLNYNHHLTEIEALPVNLEHLTIWDCPEFVKLPSFARLTSLREFIVKGCDRIGETQGLKYCTRLEILELHTCWDMPGIESLEQMDKLRSVELRVNKGLASCIQTIKKWPDEIMLCTRAVPDASSLVDSFKLGLSPNLSVIDYFSNKDIHSNRELVQNYSSNGKAIMLSFVINCSSDEEVRLGLIGRTLYAPSISICGEGRWSFITVLTARSSWHTRNSPIKITAFSNVGVKLERGLAVRGEEQRLVEVLLPLVQTISM